MNDQPDPQQIRQILIQLHEMLERAQAEGMDESDQQLMRHLMVDIQAALDRAEHGAPKGARVYDDSDSLIERMQEAVTRYEVTHPSLTLLIKKIVDTLSIAGI